MDACLLAAIAPLSIRLPIVGPNVISKFPGVTTAGQGLELAALAGAGVAITGCFGT